MDSKLEKLVTEIGKSDGAVKAALEAALEALRSGKKSVIYVEKKERFGHCCPQDWCLRNPIAEKIYLVLRASGIGVKLDKTDTLEWDDRAEAHVPTGQAAYTIAIFPHS